MVLIRHWEGRQEPSLVLERYGRRLPDDRFAPVVERHSRRLQLFGRRFQFIASVHARPLQMFLFRTVHTCHNHTPQGRSTQPLVPIDWRY